MSLDQYPHAEQSTPAAPPGSNTAAIVALTSGIVALFIIPILLGPVAIIAGAVGCGEGKRSKGVAVAGLLIGIVASVICLANMVAAFQAMGVYSR